MVDLDERTILRDNPPMLALLTLYAGSGDWRDREMAWPGSTAAELSRWHGRLLAADWIELNISSAPRVAPNEVPGCYRATPAGRRAVREVAASLH